MVNIDALAGAARYAAQTRNAPGMCLNEVYKAYGSHPSIGAHAGQYPVAYDQWLYSTQRHTDASPPAGAPVVFGPSPTRTDANKNAGDICICIQNSALGVFIRCSDGAGSGIMATMTIAARARQIARPYMGWTSDFLGYQLVNFGSAVASTGGSNEVTAQYIKNQLGVAYVTALQGELGVTADGLVGDQTIKALQTKIGTAADGIFGHNSNVALQNFLHITADGLWGNATTLAVKSGIDSGQFGSTPPVVVVPPLPTYYRPVDAPAGSLFGIDLSMNQPGFDFTAYVHGAGEDFVILKRGGSNDDTYIDSQYAALLPAARAAGLKIGHYWFNGRQGVASPTESAQAFLKNLDIQPGEIVALDIEDEGTTTPHYTAAEAMEWLGVVEAELGIKPLVYMSASVSREAQWVPVVQAGYALWVAMYSYLTTSPDAGKYVANDIDPLNVWGDGNAWQIHQWTSTVFGSMPGTTSLSLDRNIARPDTFTKHGFVKRPVTDPTSPTKPTDPTKPVTPAKPNSGLVGGIVSLIVLVGGVIAVLLGGLFK